MAIYPGSANNDPKGVGLGINYAASPLGVSYIEFEKIKLKITNGIFFFVECSMG